MIKLEADFNGSTPTLTQFDPNAVPYQWSVLKFLRKEWDHDKGYAEILLSGSVGSAKSLLMAHIVVTHCLMFPKARALLGRLTLPDLRDTLLQKVLDHMSDSLIEGRDYTHNKNVKKITFSNGSEIIYRSWKDRNYKKFRSLELSCAAIEELTENTGDNKEFYSEICQRVQRLPHVKENFVISATNPDAPSHWVHKIFMDSPTRNKKVFYSVTTDNKFLPPSYIQTLKENLDPKMAERMIYGRWIEIAQEVIYYNYSRDRNYVKTEYSFDKRIPIDIMFDFNIGEGKPMSACVGQYVDKHFHAAKTFVVEGARTQNILEEMESSNLFELPNSFRVFGDASGSHRDTRGVKSDYDIIMRFMQNYERVDGTPLKVEKRVTKANPPIRKRHNLVNSIMQDANGLVKCTVYEQAAKLDEGLRLAKLKKGGNYVEDDSDDFQHVTTAFGYWVVYTLNGEGSQTIKITSR